jgi:lysophospholipid acyltransferase (LPLAT)-like uncharacterized protein
MKIRDPRMIAIAGWVGSRLVHALASTLRMDYRSLGRVPVDPFAAPRSGHFIYALWHENFLIPISRFGNPRIAALVSSHADGQILGSLIRSSGMHVIRGSTSRGGVAAVRQLLRDHLDYQHLAVTPDGPRGPRRRVQPGIIYLASRTGMQIVPVGVGFQNPWRVNSWDTLAVPRPFSRVRCLFGEPLRIPPDVRLDALSASLEHVQDELDRITRTAEEWAEHGDLPPPATNIRARSALQTIQHRGDSRRKAGDRGRKTEEDRKQRTADTR